VRPQRLSSLFSSCFVSFGVGAPALGGWVNCSTGAARLSELDRVAFGLEGNVAAMEHLLAGLEEFARVGVALVQFCGWL